MPGRLRESWATAHLLVRGQQGWSGSLCSYVSIEERIPASHPLRRIRKLADKVLDGRNPTLYYMYDSEVRSSVTPEQPLCLLAASVLQVPNREPAAGSVQVQAAATQVCRQ